MCCNGQSHILHDAAIQCALAWRLNDLWVQNVSVSVHSPLRRSKPASRFCQTHLLLKCVCKSSAEETRASQQTGSGPKPSHRLGNPGVNRSTAQGPITQTWFRRSRKPSTLQPDDKRGSRGNASRYRRTVFVPRHKPNSRLAAGRVR